MRPPHAVAFAAITCCKKASSGCPENAQLPIDHAIDDAIGTIKCATICES